MKLLLNALLLLVITSAYAQNSISGVITDASTYEKLELVNIYSPDLEKGTTTNVEGEFTLNNLPSGSYTILFSMIGYEKQSLKVNLPTHTFLEISLVPTAIEMESIIISTPFHKLQRDNVMKVEHESVKELKANGAITLADGVSNIAGVENITTGLGISKPVIRGLSSNRVLVFTQGVRLENQQYGGEHGLGVNDAGVESVEVIKGPASLLYGSDALGGVLYLNPERFAPQDSTLVDLGANYFSNTLGFDTDLGLKTSVNNFKILVRGSLAEHADYDTPAYSVTNTRFKEADFKAGLGYQVNHFKTEFRYNINQSTLGIPDGVGEQSTDKIPLLPYQDITNQIFSSRSTFFFDASKLDINLGYIYNDRKEFEEDHDHDDHEHDEDEEDHEDEHDDHDDEDHDDHEHTDPALQMKLKTFNYDIKYSLPTIGKFETITGVQGMYQDNSNYGEEQLIPDAITNDIGVLAMSHIHFDKADVQLGIRYDYRNIDVLDGINKNYNSFNGALGVKTDIVTNISARVNLATGFRAPNLSELTSDGVHHGSNRYEIGNPNLKSEQNLQIDVALEYTTDHLEIFANGFYNMIHDYIFLAPSGNIIDEHAVYTYLQDDARLYGGEFGLHFHPHPLDWLHFESSFETVTGIQQNDDYLPLIPANALTNTIRVEFEKSWFDNGYAFIKLKNTFDQDNVSIYETRSGGYSLLSAGLGGSFPLFGKELAVTLSGNNLTNKAYISHLSRLKPENIYNIGRNISLGFNYYF